MSVNAACINFRPDPESIPDAHAALAPGEAWQVDGGRGTTAPMILREGRLYLAGADRQVRALDVETGAELWHRRLPGPILGGVLLGDSLLFVASARPDDRIHALDLATGRTAWTAAAGDLPEPLALAGGAVAGVNRRGHLVGFDARTGAVRFRRRVGRTRLQPIAAEAAFLVAAGDSVLRIEPDSGRVVARGRLPVLPLEWQAARERIVLTGADSSVVALEPATFSVAWRAILDGPVLGPLTFRGDTAWAVTRRGTIYELTLPGPRTRVVARLGEPITTGVTPLGRHLLVGGADGALRALTREGAVAWRVNLSWNITVDPVPVPGGFLAAGGDGDLH
ncbi:MAG TPA: PQQ-binding-like beta-propeller repeat protein, partial [Gemmatimonadales bacterium]